MKKIVFMLMCILIVFAQAQENNTSKTTAQEVGGALGTISGTIAFVAVAIVTIPLQLVGVVKVGNPFKDSKTPEERDATQNEDSKQTE
ncbi:MAG: hypothetical protein PHN38_10045 [Sulfurospirillaceae bacterium]|nr:hypothetical protein [Sulfurospirillaceae bacterium]MDD3463355.1 hypothetical protein [Sulfurospirillaceae bacterium]